MKNTRSTALAALLATSGLACSARAQFTDATKNWNNAVGGSAGISSNWSPTGVPLATDDLIFGLGGSYGVTFGATTTASRTHTYKQGSVTLTMSSPHTVSNGVTIGSVAGDNATATLATGTWTVGGFDSVIGEGAGSIGVLSVNDSTADYVTGAGFNLFAGASGNGTLNITNRGHVQVGGNFLSTTSSTGIGATLVSGSLATAPFGRSLLEVLGAGESRIGQSGDATMTVSSGALADFAGSLAVATGSSSTSSLTVGGAVLFDATLDVGADLNLGRNIAPGSAAGNATTTVNGGGTVSVAGAIRVGGDPDGGTGVLRLNAGSFVTAHDIVAGVGGDIQHVGGVMEIDGGSLTNDTPVVTVSNTPANNPLLRLINGGSASATATSNPGRALIVGGTAGTSTGALDIQSGGDMLVFANPIGGIVDASIAVASDDTGSVSVAGAGSTLQSTNTNSTLFIGEGGNATASVSAGGLVSFGTVNVSAASTSTSTVSIDGAGSEVEARVQLNVGGSSTGLGGIATMTVGNGGRIDAPVASATAVRIWQDGEVIVDAGGQLTTIGTVDVRSGGLLTLNGGLTSAANVMVGGGGNIAGNGTVQGDITVQAGGGITANGTLVIGNTSSVLGLVMAPAATLSVGAFGVTVNDSNTSGLGTVTIAGGSLTSLHGMQLASGSSIAGTGVVTGTVSMGGGSTMTATGASGLRFNNIVISTAGGLSGTIFGFNNGGGYNGQGTIAAKVDFDAGSTLFNGGALTMGDNTPAGVTFDGTMHVGTGTVTLLDSNGVGLGQLTELNGGTLACANQLVVNSIGPIQGHGDVQSPLLLINTGGRIKPGDIAAVDDSINLLRVVGAGSALTLGAGSFYDCDLGLDFKGFHASDRVTSTGPLTLGGTLTVHLVTGFTPDASDIFDIAIGATRTGVFASTVFPPVGSFGPMHVEYLPDRARLVMCYANCDGSVVSPTLNVLDFSCFLNKFAAGDPYANCDASTTPPVLNVLDFACFLNKFAAGCN